MLVVVGPSGAGKDTLMDYARERLANETKVGFVQRFITRDHDAGGEAHYAVTSAEFDRLRAEGAFALSWSAHGLCYGVPIDTLARIASGDTLVVNGSRAAIRKFVSTYPHVRVISITATPEIVAQRLAGRGRESVDEIRLRLARSQQAWQSPCACTEIDNSGAVESAGEALIEIIRDTLDV
jgi:ribose 1,5-bisphosphokinase